MLLGAAAGIALCEAVNPMSKRDFKKSCSRANKMANRMMKKVGRMSI